ncbi:hypothetical protein BGW80DRAFT_730416 [Lactifluus volemus]|nr:hypothetical protein BGW80DRAFT_730416 [Lactifluus volemus]
MSLVYCQCTGQLRDLRLDLLGGGVAPARVSSPHLVTHSGLNGSGSAASSSEGVSTQLPAGVTRMQCGTRASSACISRSPLRAVTSTSLPLLTTPCRHRRSHHRPPRRHRRHRHHCHRAHVSPMGTPRSCRRNRHHFHRHRHRARVSRKVPPSPQSDFSRQPYLYMVAIHLPSQGIFFTLLNVNACDHGHQTKCEHGSYVLTPRLGMSINVLF